MKISLHTEVDVEDLALQLDENQALGVILAIDQEQQDWEFTEKVAHRFLQELCRLDDKWKEVSELFVKVAVEEGSVK